MKNKSLAVKCKDDLRKECGVSQLKGGIQGKYYQQATAGTNVVLIEPDLLHVFPDGKAVNRALRILAEAARSASSSKRRPNR